jgi:hypothetical protein
MSDQVVTKLLPILIAAFGMLYIYPNLAAGSDGTEFYLLQISPRHSVLEPSRSFIIRAMNTKKIRVIDSLQFNDSQHAFTPFTSLSTSRSDLELESSTSSFVPPSLNIAFTAQATIEDGKEVVTVAGPSQILESLPAISTKIAPNPSPSSAFSRLIYPPHAPAPSLITPIAQSLLQRLPSLRKAK